jgi:hypothetical protein
VKGLVGPMLGVVRLCLACRVFGGSPQNRQVSRFVKLKMGNAWTCASDGGDTNRTRVPHVLSIPFATTRFSVSSPLNLVNLSLSLSLSLSLQESRTV